MTNKDGINSLHIVAFTHRSLSVSDIGQLHIAPENQQVRLVNIKDGLNLGELMFDLRNSDHQREEIEEFWKNRNCLVFL